jgi:hypothetical protein
MKRLRRWVVSRAEGNRSNGARRLPLDSGRCRTVDMPELIGALVRERVRRTPKLLFLPYYVG